MGVSAIKTYRIAKNVILLLTILLAFSLILIGRVPAFPSSKPITPGDYGAEVRGYVLENLFTIVFFVASMVGGILIETFSLAIERNFGSLKGRGKSGVMLGIFIFVSGVWVLTDSKVLAVFTTDYGGTLNSNAAVLISYACFMLRPIIFISFLQYVVQISRGIWIIDGLFILNLFTFVICAGLYLPKKFYFLFLIVHHAVIYILMVIGTIYCIRNLRGTRDQQKKWLSHGVILFLVFSGGALAVFLSGFPHLYAVIYGIGFIIMIYYMVKITVHTVLSTYSQSIKMELYKSLAFTDILTDMKNRNAFIQEQDGRAVDESTCCLVMDINRLKWANDTFGHDYGDQLIRRCAKVIRDAFSNMGNCYRIGGDEFAVVCQNTNESAAKAAIEKMEKLICAANTDSGPKISLSWGCAFGGNGIGEFADLFNAADQKMYLDKKSKGSIRQ